MAQLIKRILTLSIILLLTSNSIGKRQSRGETEEKANTTRECLPGYGLEKLTDMKEDADYNYCYEHAGRTCCNGTDTMKIREKVALAKLKSSGNDEQSLSDMCLLMTSRALCSNCDGDLSTGKTEGLCLSFCDSWFLSCLNDYLDPYKNKDKLPFCEKDSMICSQVKEYEAIQNSREWCTFMGFKVQSYDDIERSGKQCYDGTPSNLKASNKAEKQTWKQGYSEQPPSPEQQYKEFVKDQFDTLFRRIQRSPYLESIQQIAIVVGLGLGGYIIYNLISCWCYRKKTHGNFARRAAMEQARQNRVNNLGNKKGK